MSFTHSIQTQLQHLDREIETMQGTLERRRRDRERLARALDLAHGITVVHEHADASALVYAALSNRGGQATTDELARDVHRSCPQYAVQRYRSVRRKVQVYLSRWDWVRNVGRGRWELIDG